MRSRGNQAGFSAFEVIVAVLVVAIIAVAGCWVYNRNHTAQPGTTQANSSDVSSPKATDVSPAPQINNTGDLTKAEQVLDQNDPATANSADSNQLNNQLAGF
jgi:prepilin-type N-terminal cleavage/methylation domain-containing protein